MRLSITPVRETRSDTGTQENQEAQEEAPASTLDGIGAIIIHTIGKILFP